MKNKGIFRKNQRQDAGTQRNPAIFIAPPRLCVKQTHHRGTSGVRDPIPVSDAEMQLMLFIP
jgi:hypothetical protein